MWRHSRNWSGVTTGTSSASRTISLKMVRIAVNESLMKLRRRRSDRMVSLDEEIETEEDTMPREVADWSPNPEQLYKQGELKEILRKTVQGLPPSFRTVFVLRD